MISEQSQEIYASLECISKIKIDQGGATIYNGLLCKRLNKQKEEDFLKIAAEVNSLAREEQDRAPNLIGVASDTLDGCLEQFI